MKNNPFHSYTKKLEHLTEEKTATNMGLWQVGADGSN